MLHPSGTWACVLTLWLGALLAAAPLPIGPQHKAFFDDRGVWRLEGEKGALLSECGLRLWAKEGFAAQANAKPSRPPGEGAAGRTFHGIIRVRDKAVEYWQTATPLPSGLLVQYAVAAGALAESDEVAACFDLPLAAFAEGACAVEGGKPVSLPAAKAPQPRLVEQTATTLRVERGGVVLAFQRRPAGKLIVQDARHWDNARFEVLLYLRRAAGDPPGWRSGAFLVSLGEPAAGPVIAAVVPGREALGCGDIHEAEVVFWAPYENPFDPAQVRVWAEVTAPSGQGPRPRAAVSRAGFYCRDYARSLTGDAEQLTPIGHGRWRLRLTPTEPGVHSYVAKVTTPAGTASARAETFSAAASLGQGFLRAPRRQKLYLEHAGGEPCFLIGHNYCWPGTRRGAAELEAALERMARSGINATRVWLCSWGIGIEGERPDDYRLDDAWRLDRVLAAARERGVYVQLCLDNFQDLVGKEHAARNPYLAANGGPCAEPAQFFSLPKAREQHRRRLDYLIARYAPFTSVLAWELFNEVNYAAARPNDPAVLDWAREAGAHLKKADPHAHPVTISLGLQAAWDELWRLEEIDIVQPHAYIRRPTEDAAPAALDSAALVLEQRDAAEALGKPVLIAELGFLGTADFNPLNEADKTGVHLHAALWAAAMSGCAGTAMNWWWNSYIVERDLHYHYAALAAFLRAGPLPGPDWVPVRSKASSPVLVLGFRGRDAAMLWIRHRDNTWFRRAVEGREAAPLGRTALDLPRLADGRYRVEWWDAYSGQPLTHVTALATEGTLRLSVPERLPDVACRVRRQLD